jgi:hypothetical protein
MAPRQDFALVRPSMTGDDDPEKPCRGKKRER